MTGKVKILISYKEFFQNLTKEHLQKIKAVASNVELDLVLNREDLLRKVKDAEVVFGWLERETFLAAEKIRWIHLPWAGVDSFLFPELLKSEVILTNSSGICRIPMSEMIIAMMLMFAKKLNRFIRFQIEKKWNRIVPDELTGKTAGFLGLGNVGMETAWKAKCLGMKVIALKKTAIRRPTYVDEILMLEDLDYLLKESDYLVLSLPLTKETYHLIDKEKLQKMKSNSYIINVGRGEVINEKELVQALKNNWIAGAGLDTFEEEPLSKNSELWKMDNVIVTPHVSGPSPYYFDRAVNLFCKNLKRHLNGKRLHNIIDKKAGY